MSVGIIIHEEKRQFVACLLKQRASPGTKFIALEFNLQQVK